jgi:hypothetical protein
MGSFDERIDRIDEVLGADGNGDCDNHKNESSSPRPHLWFFGMFIFGGLLSVEKIGVGTELEDKIENI